MFHDVNIDLDDEVYVYLLDTDSPIKDYLLYEVYKVQEKSAPVINHLGSWSPDTYSMSIEDMERSSRRHDLRVSFNYNFQMPRCVAKS